MSSKLSFVFLIILFSIITTSPITHGQILGPIVGSVPSVVSPIVPTVCTTVNSVPSIVNQSLPVNITILGSLSCASANILGPGIGGVNVTIICRNVTVAQVMTNNQGLFTVTFSTNTTVLFGNTPTLSCVARVGLPIANCTVFPNSGTIQAPVLVVGNIIQAVGGLIITAVIGLLGSIVTVT